MEVVSVRAFCLEGDGGNLAGVVLDTDGLEQIDMQKIAQMVGYSETAFVFEKNGKTFIRYFTVTNEVDYCGHASLASLYLLEKNGKRVKSFTCKAGDIDVIYENGNIYMKQAFAKKVPKEIDLKELSKILNLNEIKKEDALVWSTGLEDIILLLKDEQTLKNLSPDMKRLSALSKKMDITGLHAFCIDKDTVYCRNFAPAVGIDEESATGSSNGALAAFWKDKNNLDNFSLHCYQGQYMGSPSLIEVLVKGNNIYVGGKCCMD